MSSLKTSEAIFRATGSNFAASPSYPLRNLTAANTTPGSSTIVYAALIPHGGGMVDRGIEMAFSVAMTCYVVTGKADNDTTDAGTGDVLVNIQYR